MRLLMIVLACTAGLSAQAVESEASAKLRQFEQNLANAMKAPALRTLSIISQPSRVPEARVCAIPLLTVGPDASFKSNMPVVTPDAHARFATREVIPPAPVCDEQVGK